MWLCGIFCHIAKRFEKILSGETYERKSHEKLM